MDILLNNMMMIHNYEMISVPARRRRYNSITSEFRSNAVFMERTLMVRI